MKLKPKEIDSITVGLRSLDGLQKPAGPGGRDIVFEPFLYSSKTTWNKTKNLTLLKRFAEELETTRLDLVKQFSGSITVDVPAAKLPDFVREWNALIDQPQEFAGLLSMTEAELNLYDPKENPTGNRIASSVLEKVTPLIVFPETK